MLRTTILAAAVLAFCCAPSRAGEDDSVGDALDGLSGAKVLELVKELAADEMKGRKTAFEGGGLVENWMLGKFSEFGLHPADSGGTYLEPFTYPAANTVGPILCKVAGKALVYGRDYYDLIYSGAGKVKAEAVFCGYGICRPDLGWDDYAGIDVKGKVVVAIRGAPGARAAEFRAERYIGSKSSTAADKGAVGFLLVQGPDASSGTIQGRFHRGTLPSLWVSGKAADPLFAVKKKTLKELKATRDAGEPGMSFATGVQVEMEVHATFVPRAVGHNALGDIKGRDPDLNHEVILVGAHMDHLGVGPTGEVFNGADDNASGTAVLVHLADVLTANRFRPKRTIVFCGFGAEEQGLFGSRALAERYPFRGQVVAVLNMDMVGQGEPVVRISGVGAYPAMHERFQRYLPKDLQAKTEFGLRTGAGGDHWPFHERGVPAFFIATKGKHPNYHTPQDDVAHIKAECLEAAARTVGTLLVRLATDPKPLTDPLGVASYLVREGPRFALAELNAATGAVEYSKEALAAGATGLFVLVPGTQDPAQSWKALEALERAEGDVAFRLVRRAADVGRAYQEGRVALLPCLHCPEASAGDPKHLTAYAKLGYRLMDPWSALGAAPALSDVQAVGEACRSLKVLVDLSSLTPAHWPAARKALGDRPAYLSYMDSQKKDAAWLSALASLGSETLPVRLWDEGVSWGAGMDLAEGLPPFVALEGPSPDGLNEAVAAWGTQQPAGWDLPGSPQRKAIRGALGGHLVEWLARAER